MRISLFACAVPMGLLLPGLLSTPAPAQGTSFTATGWVNQVFAPGIFYADALGQLLARANMHSARVQSPDARVTGQVLVLVDGSFNADGTANMWGPAYLQVGTWDSAGTNFTPTGGTWEWTWRGLMQTNYSMQLGITAYGVGGTIDGQRLEATLTRAPASGPIDFTVPYLYTGTIKPAPVNTSAVVDDFYHPFTGATYGNGTCFDSNNLFCAVGDHFLPTHSIYNSYVFGGYATHWTVADGMTLEWRGGLVSLDDNGTNTAILTVGTDTGPGYAFHKGANFAFLLKWSSTFSYCALSCQRVALPNSNVILALALTRIGTNLAITTRVLDKADPNKVLYQNLVVDTPNADSALTRSQFKALTGIDFQDLAPDAVEAPPTSFGAALGVFQNTDGHQPVPTAVFDKLELLTYEVPHISIAPAMQLTWPGPAGTYSVESAPAPSGPWAPVHTLAMPGVDQMTVPASDPMRFFRLVQAP